MDHEQHDMRETCETAHAAMDQAIPRLAGDIAAGRAEEPGFFPKKIHNVNFFRKRKRMHHTAASSPH